jgi:hypothetical protein
VIDLSRGDPLDDRHVGVRQCALQRELVRFEKACCQQERAALVAVRQRVVSREVFQQNRRLSKQRGVGVGLTEPGAWGGDR